MKGEGHFIALLKKGEVKKRQGTSDKGRAGKIPEELEEFLEGVDRGFSIFRGSRYGEDRVYYMPEDVPDLKGVRFLRTGLLMGELRRNASNPVRLLP